MTDIYSSLRSAGRLHTLSDDMGDLFALHIRNARAGGATWASIARDANVTPRTVRKYAARVIHTGV